jgi:hypothetical protein
MQIGPKARILNSRDFRNLRNYRQLKCRSSISEFLQSLPFHELVSKESLYHGISQTLVLQPTLVYRELLPKTLLRISVGVMI